jgi:ABC-type lipoprotein export system ATPase subunit
VTGEPLALLDHVQFRREGGFRLAAHDVRLEAGEAVAVVGPSGCGKTTLVHLVAGIVAPDSGHVIVQGTDLAALSDDGRRALRIRDIGMVFQRFALLEHLTGLENVLLPYHVSSALRLDDAAISRARSLAEHLGVSHALDRKPERLSQGERQRLAIARALVTAPDLLLADEPTGNLDPDRSLETIELLIDEARQRRAGLLVATHDHALLEHFDRVLEVGDNGEVQAA